MAIYLPPKPSSGAGNLPPVPEAPASLYGCDCRGFRENDLIHFCLRCLDHWVAGLPGVFSGERLEREMRKAAGILARRLKEEPALGRMKINAAFEASERRV